MIKALISGLKELCDENPRIIILIADDKEVYDALIESYPDRVINIGISECNAISVGAGLASCENIPYVIGGNSFMAYRAYEFIRDQLCMQNRNVKVIGIGAGLAISVLGNTQHATEDISALRVLPNLTIMTPATATEVYEMVRYSLNITGPMFMRIGRACGKDFYQKRNLFLPYRVQEIKEGKDFVVFSTGSIVCNVLEVANELENENYSVGVVNVHTVKPIDKEGIIALSEKYHKWLSIEEHNMNGGLGSILAEIIVDEKLSVDLLRVGLEDRFAKGHGTYEALKQNNGLGIDNIKEVCLRLKDNN